MYANIEVNEKEKSYNQASGHAAWREWCRLCAKADKRNLNIFLEDVNAIGTTIKREINEEVKLDVEIENFFRVKITMYDQCPINVCLECFSLIMSLIKFGERVKSAQEMYAELENLDYLYDDKTMLDFQASLRLKYNVLEDYEPHGFMYHGSSAVAEINLMESQNLEMHNEKEYDAAETSSFYTEDEIMVENPPVADEVKCEPSHIHTDNTFSKDIDSANDANDVPGGNVQVGVEENFEEHDIGLLTEYELITVVKRKERQTNKAAKTSKKSKKEANNRDRSTKDMQNGENQYQCSHCQQILSGRTSLHSHIKFVHLRKRPFICEECGTGVRTRSELKDHMLRHTDDAPFQCEECKKCFKNEKRLKKHMDTHTPNTYPCPECGLQLKTRATLYTHALVHSDATPHKCDYCGKAFKRSKALKSHLIIHAGLRPYICNFCQENFSSPTFLRLHKLKYHPKELAEFEASGAKQYTKGIPNLAVLKSLTRSADTLVPVTKGRRKLIEETEHVKVKFETKCKKIVT